LAIKGEDNTNELTLELLAEIERLQQELDRVTALNRHYLHFFYQGDVMKFQADFEYIRGD
jgi:hypothetical protein